MRCVGTTFLLVIFYAACATASDWPSVAFPNNAQVSSIGEQVKLNGVPMQMYQVLSADKPEVMLRFYQQALGSRHVITALANGILISQTKGSYFINIRITPINTHQTEALVSISDMLAAKNNANRPLGFDLPSESQVLSDLESSDAGKSSRQLVFTNRHAIDINESLLIDMLKTRGYKLQADDSKLIVNGKTLNFNGNKQEARLVITQANGISNVILTTVQTP